jgi:hypothetical protein
LISISGDAMYGSKGYTPIQGMAGSARQRTTGRVAQAAFFLAESAPRHGRLYCHSLELLFGRQGGWEHQTDDEELAKVDAAVGVDVETVQEPEGGLIQKLVGKAPGRPY